MTNPSDALIAEAQRLADEEARDGYHEDARIIRDLLSRVEQLTQWEGFYYEVRRQRDEAFKGLTALSDRLREIEQEMRTWVNKTGSPTEGAVALERWADQLSALTDAGQKEQQERS